MELLQAFRTQARACRELGSSMYGDLLDRAADDLETGGTVSQVLAGHEDDPGPSALALRLLGSVHRLVLERRAGALAAYYPSVGGTWEPSAGWQAFLRLLDDEPGAVAEWLDRAPQTNEVGRATALYGGLLHLDPQQPVRLFEIGASAGLNLRADRFGYLDDRGRRFGRPDSPLLIAGAWRGRPLDSAPVRIVARVGCDLRPIDTSTTEGRLALTAYVWPDQRARLERLRAALVVADQVPVDLRAQGARELVDSVRLEHGTTTVLWHSVMWQYLPPQEQEAVTRRIEELGAAATQDSRFVHLRAEPWRRTPESSHVFLVRLRTWPGGEDRVIGETVAHGVPTTWE